MNSSELYSVTSEGSFPVNSEDYTELYDSLNDQYCDEDKVCCLENVRYGQDTECDSGGDDIEKYHNLLSWSIP